MNSLRFVFVGALVALLGAACTASAQTTTSVRRSDVGPARLVGPDVLRILNGDPTRRVERAIVSSVNASKLNEVPKPESPWMPPAEHLDGAPRIEAFNYYPRLRKSWNSHPMWGEPADPMIAAGLGHVVSVVNFRIIVNDKAGNELFNSGLDSFFGVPAGEPTTFDAKVAYDANDDRFWVIAIAASCGATKKSRVYVALSNSADPMTGWSHYGPFDNLLDNNWADYPGLGISDRTITLTWNYVPCPGAPVNHGNAVWVFYKTPMLTGGGTFFDAFDDVRLSNGQWPGTMVPAIAWDPPSNVQNFIACLPYDASAAQLRPTLIGLQLPADYPTGFPTLNLQSSTAGNPGPMLLGDQRGGPAKIVTWNLGSPPFSCVYRNGWVVAASHFGYGTTGATQIMTFRFAVSFWPTISVVTEGFTDGVSDYYWPAAAINSFGDVMSVFSRSSSTEYVGSRFTMRYAGDAASTSSQTLQAGADYYGEAGDNATTAYRWGDYAGCAVDPVDEGFWVFNTHAEPRYPGGFSRTWGTRIGYIPRAVFVDVAHTGPQQGRRSAPYRTVALGNLAVLGGNDLVIRTGSYPEAVTFRKSMVIVPDGGPVTIGR